MSKAATTRLRPPVRSAQLGLARRPRAASIRCSSTSAAATPCSTRARSRRPVAIRDLYAAGVRRFRVELVRESADETATVLRAYRALLDGKAAGKQVIAEVGALETYGVSAGTLVVVTEAHA